MESTRIATFVLLLASSNALAQDPAANASAHQRLARIQAVESQEGDLAAAERGYRELLADASLSVVHDEAALALGTLLWRLDRREEAAPLLRRAAEANGDLAERVAALEAQDGELRELQQGRVEQAEVLIQRLAELINATQGEVTDANIDAVHYIERQLLELGEATVSAIVAQLEPRATYTNYIDRRLARLLWQMPSTRAAAFLAREATTNRHELGPIDEHRLALVTIASEVADDLSAEARPSLLEFARCPDPTREILRFVILTLEKQPVDFVLSAFEDPHPRVSEAGLMALDDDTRWRSASPGSMWRETFVQQHGERLLAWVESERTEPARAAVGLLASKVALYDGGLSLVLEAVRRAPQRAPTELAYLSRDDGRRLRAVAKAAATAPFGPLPETGEPTEAQSLLQLALIRGGADWDASFVGDAMTLVELGYAQGIGGSWWRNQVPPSAKLGEYEHYHWLGRAYRLGSDEQRAAILARVPTLADPRMLLETASQVPARQPLFGAVVAASTVNGRAANEETGASLIRLAVRSGDPRCAAWLTSQLEQQPGLTHLITHGLVLLSRAGQAGARAGLREVLIAEARGSDEWTRSQALFELTRVGDSETIALLPRALDLGFWSDSPSGIRPFEHSGSQDGISEAYSRYRWKGISAGYAPLVCFGDGDLASGGRWHAYDDAQLSAAWDALLTGVHAVAIWETLGNQGHHALPAVALPHVAARLEGPGDPSLDRRELVRRVRAALGALDPAALDAAPEQKQAVERMLDHPDPVVAAYVFSLLNRDTAQRYAERAVARLLTSPSIEWLRAVRGHGLEVPEAAWRAALAGPDARSALFELPSDPPASLRPMIEGVLAHADEDARVMACKVLARLYGADAAQALLSMLQDDRESVRNTAREQLQLLREAQEQRRFWASANGGVDLSPQAVSQKLVQQAMPGGDTEARLLAIRSLAAVGATEALPHLIEWSTEDSDEEVRTAAQEAVKAILRRSETGK